VSRLLVASAPEAGGGGVVLVDTGSGEKRTLARVEGLGCLARNPGLPVLYGIGRAPEEVLHVWRCAGEELEHLATVPLPGSGACSAAVVGGYLVIAHFFSSGVTSLPLDADGVPCRGRTTVFLQGAGPERPIQDRAHPHHVLARDGSAVVADMGADCLWWLRPADLVVEERLRLPAGCGPRHTAALRDGGLAVSGELDVTLLVVPRDGAVVAVPCSTLPSAMRTYPSDLVAHPAGLVAVANRNAGTLGLVDLAGDAPRLVDEQPCGGPWPLNLALDGDVVAVAQRNDDVVALVHLDPVARSLTPARQVPLPRPTWVEALDAATPTPVPSDEGGMT
jgi:6-phosphogluconolactonase